VRHSQPHKIDELTSLVHPRDGHEKVFAMIEAYLDESGIHGGAKMCVIAGYFGGIGQMRKLEMAWKKTLADFKFPMRDFHAKDLLNKRDHLPMLKALARVAGEQRKVYPVTNAIVIEDFYSFSLQQRRFMTGATLDPKSRKLITSGCPNKPYFVPFQNVLKVVTDFAPVGGKAHFNFGLGTQFSEYAITLFRQIIDNPPPADSAISTWKSRDRLGTALFPLADETAQIQAADLLVHIEYRMLDDWRVTGKTGQSPKHIYQLLELCMANMRSREDHVFQDKALLQQVIGQAKNIVPGWKDA
jgi:hypothetical protein